MPTHDTEELDSLLLQARTDEYGDSGNYNEAKLKQLITAREQVIREEAKREGYLSSFSYVDWEIGDDNKLRVGEYINCNHQRPHDGYEQNFEGQIVAHHANGVPVVLYNIDPKEPDNSGEYADLQSLMMHGWEFSRLAALHPTNKQQGKEVV